MFVEKNIHVDDINVSYIDEGHGIPLIFIHGFPFSKMMWQKQIQLLMANYRCIAYDIRGHGKSDGSSSEFSIAQFADDLIAFMQELRIEKSVLCGLSMGGYIALHIVEKSPEKVLALALCDTQCKADTDEAREKRIRTIAFIQQTGLTKYADESVKSLFAPTSLETKKIEVDFIRNTILASKSEYVCKTLMALAKRKNTCSVLSHLKIPVLILVGTEDKVTPLAAAEFMKQQLPSSILHTITDAAHVSNLENPVQFTFHLESFLKSVTPISN